MARKDYYQILGIQKGASEEEIKKAYRALARKYHPDLHPGDKDNEARFKEINEAYSVLSDPRKKQEYDLGNRVIFEPGTGATYPPGGFNFEDFGFGGGGAGGGGGFEDIFGEIFGRRRGPARGTDIEFMLELDFLQAAKGTEVKVTVSRPAGSEKINVKIPAGVEDGSFVRVPGKGNEGFMKGPPGDLHLHIKVRPHPYFKRENADIYVEVPITISEALLGGEIQVPTIDGFTRIKIQPGTTTGQKLRIKGKGVYTNGGRGDEYIIINIAGPKTINERSKELAKELADANPYEPRKGLW